MFVGKLWTAKAGRMIIYENARSAALLLISYDVSSPDR